MPEELRRQQDWPAPGWYHDPYDSQGERYWDGLRWDMGDLKHVESNGAIDRSLLPAVIPMQIGADYSASSKVMTKVLWVAVLLLMAALFFTGMYGLIIAGFLGAIASVVSLIHRQRMARGMSLVPLVTVTSIILLTVGIFGSVVNAGSITPGAANPQANNVVPPRSQVVPTPSIDPFGSDTTPSTQASTPTPAATGESQTQVVPEGSVQLNTELDADSEPITAVCADNSLSYSHHASGTCSHHGGVSRWVNHPAS